ncbi:DNA-directed DNA polymerase alpha subunit pol12 [Coemansia sp. BCRC 34301]|nr:DNA-directed DNA polymerase alpha subunit pol12 [Coemansia sp. BCRC 34301]
MSSTADLLQAFGGANLEPDAVAECLSICQTFDLSTSELFIRWQTFLINQHAGDVTVQPTRERLLSMRALVQQEQERRFLSQRKGLHASQPLKLSRNKERTHYDKNSVEGLLQGMVSGSQRDPLKTPQSTKRVGLLKAGVPASRSRVVFSPTTPSVFAEPSPSAIRFSNRTTMGRTEDSLHSDLPPLALPPDRPPAVVCDLVAKLTEAEALSSEESEADNDEEPDTNRRPATTKRMRYMFEKVGTRTEVINRRIERMAIETKTAYKIDALANPTYAHQVDVIAVGRILNINLEEGQTTAPITSDSLALETSRRLGNGRRTPLDVRAAPSFSLFPGQMVAIEGKNLKGTEFLVSQFRPLPRLPHPRIGERAGGLSPFSAVVAAGPYTLADNFEYEPLGVLVDHIVAFSPSVVFLLGPFVSEGHPMIRDGMADMLPEDIFCAKISPLLSRLREGLPPTSTIYLLPSADELCYPYASFPQPRFSREMLLQQLGVPPGIESLDNPAQVSVNGVVFGISNIDALFHFVKEEVSRLPALSDRLPRLAWHLIEQRHFYPLSPPPAECAGVLASHDSRLRMQTMPDILITPSQLKPFARAHDNVILLNPGFSSKGLAGGTFAKISVHPTADGGPSGAVLGDPELAFPARFTAVDIVRI